MRSDGAAVILQRHLAVDIETCRCIFLPEKEEDEEWRSTRLSFAVLLQRHQAEDFENFRGG
jgi:hypothetical protein